MEHPSRWQQLGRHFVHGRALRLYPLRPRLLRDERLGDRTTTCFWAHGGAHQLARKPEQVSDAVRLGAGRPSAGPRLLVGILVPAAAFGHCRSGWG